MSDTVEEISDILENELASDVRQSQKDSEDVQPTEMTSDVKDIKANSDKREESPTRLLDGGKLQNIDIEEVETKKKFPRSVFFIVGNEFCERFSYYGMRTVLMYYLTDALNMSSTKATVVYHTFVMICYFTPILGSMLADGFLGKFRTILYVSFIYALGNIVLSVASIDKDHFPMLPMSMVGLFLISLGTGGIKPCVSAFGGDQFDNDQILQRERFFFIFYFAINAGSLISTFVTPILRADVQCFNAPTCFPLAFGLPALLMLISIIMFVAGKSLYRMVPPKGNVVVKVSKCIGHAIARRCKTKDSRDHWLDYADDKYDKKFINDVRAALRVMFLYIPLPIFWALYDQQGSRWNLQAQELDGKLTDSYYIIPDQMQVVNPLLILLFIPLFDMGIYPLLAKCNILTKSLTRMFVGGMLAALAFVVAGVLELNIEAQQPTNPSAGQVDFVFINNGPCPLHLNASHIQFNRDLDPQTFIELMGVSMGDDSGTFPLQVTSLGDCSSFEPQTMDITYLNKTAYSLVFGVSDTAIYMDMKAQLRERAEDGLFQARLAYEVNPPIESIILMKKDESVNCTYNVTTSHNITGYCPDLLNPGNYFFYMVDRNGNKERCNATLRPENGAEYIISLYPTSPTDNTKIKVTTYAEVPPNGINMLWQIPQYVIITAGEIMFSITGLEFSYSQAPASMKSVLQAAWLITDAFGNLIIIIIEEIKFFDKESYEYFLFAGIMAFVMLIFVFLCWNYVYVTIDSDGNVIYPADKDEKDGKKTNNGMAEVSKKNGEVNQSFQDDHDL